MFVRARMPCGPKCFKCRLLIPSGPVLDVFLVFLIVLCTCSVVKGLALWSTGNLCLCCENCLSASVRVGVR